MDSFKRRRVMSKQSKYRIICLAILLAIIMSKIVSYKCHNLTGSIIKNNAQKVVFSVAFTDFLPCSGKSNCYYQRNTKDCSSISQLSIELNFTETHGFKPPPLIAALSLSRNKNKGGLLDGEHFAMDRNKPLELIVCDSRIDLLQWGMIDRSGQSVLWIVVQCYLMCLIFCICRLCAADTDYDSDGYSGETENTKIQ